MDTEIEKRVDYQQLEKLVNTVVEQQLKDFEQIRILSIKQIRYIITSIITITILFMGSFGGTYYRLQQIIDIVQKYETLNIRYVVSDQKQSLGKLQKKQEASTIENRRMIDELRLKQIEFETNIKYIQNELTELKQ